MNRDVRWRQRIGIMGVSILALSPLDAAGDVVLHPGTLGGTVGLTDAATFAYGSVTISGNANGFTSTTQINGSTYTLNTEGGQTYSAISASLYDYSQGYRSFSIQRSNAAIEVPVADTIVVDLARPGGIITGHIEITGGSVASVEYYASGSTTNESYSARAQGSSGDVSFSMATGTVSVRGSATINVTGGNGEVLCTTNITFPLQTVALPAGDVTVNNTVTMTPDVCGQAVLAGTVGLHSVPGGIQPSYSDVYSGGPTYKSAHLLGNDQTYQFEGLNKGYYSPFVYMYFPAPYSAEYMHLPNQSPPRVDLTSGGSALRDFTFEGGTVTGNLSITGSAARYARSGNQYFYGTYDAAQPNYGPTAGGYAGSSIDLSDGSYTAILTEGQWQQGSTSLQFDFSASTITRYSYVNVSQQVNISAPAGQSSLLPAQSLEASMGTIVFDVIEPANSPVIGITNPYVYASYNDTANNRYISSQAYTYVSNVASPAVHLVGPPGTYTFDAYATVGGSTAKFARSTISIGAAVNTPVGNGVTIVPLDSNGQPTPIDLKFEEVTGVGETSVSITDVGPGVPADYTLLEVIGGNQLANIGSGASFAVQADGGQYININTNASFVDQVEISHPVRSDRSRDHHRARVDADAAAVRVHRRHRLPVEHHQRRIRRRQRRQRGRHDDAHDLWPDEQPVHLRRPAAGRDARPADQHVHRLARGARPALHRRRPVHGHGRQHQPARRRLRRRRRRPGLVYLRRRRVAVALPRPALGHHREHGGRRLDLDLRLDRRRGRW